MSGLDGAPDEAHAGRLLGMPSNSVRRATALSPWGRLSCNFTRRRNSLVNRSIALVVRGHFHWLFGWCKKILAAFLDAAHHGEELLLPLADQAAPGRARGNVLMDPVEAIPEALKKGGGDHETVVYPGAAHGLFGEWRADTAENAWERAPLLQTAPP